MDRFTNKITEYLLSKIVHAEQLSENVKNQEMRKKYAYLEAFVSIVVNIILAGIKVTLGIMLNSISILADAAHTASDVVTSLVVLLGFKIASSPADEKHPYGHGRMEFLVTLMIAIMLIIVGIQFASTSYERFLGNSTVRGNYYVALIMLICALLKEWMARFSTELGLRINAAALIADAWHHRTDAIASLLVAVAIIASSFGYYKVDALFGMGVSALIIYTGIKIAKESASKLIGEAAEKDFVMNIKENVLDVPGVVGIHKINVHDYGTQKVISLHIQVDQSMSLIKAHDISDQVEKTIEEANIGSKAIVHVEPDIAARKK